MAASRALNDQLRMLFEGAPNGVMAVDAAGCIIQLNAQMEKMFGYSREKLIGRPASTFDFSSFADERLFWQHARHSGCDNAWGSRRPVARSGAEALRSRPSRSASGDADRLRAVAPARSSEARYLRGNRANYTQTRVHKSWSIAAKRTGRITYQALPSLTPLRKYIKALTRRICRDASTRIALFSNGTPQMGGDRITN